MDASSARWATFDCDLEPQVQRAQPAASYGAVMAAVLAEIASELDVGLADVLDELEPSP